MMRPSEHLRRESKSPWMLPLYVLITFVMIVLIGVVLSLVLTGCGPSDGRQPAYDNGAINQQTSTKGIEERKIKLSDGRTVTCVTWVDSGYQYENTASGISCDWGVKETTE